MNSPYHTAGLLRRLAAFIYDFILLFALSMAYAALAMLIQSLFMESATVNNQPVPVRGILFQIGWLATLIGFYCFFWIKGGQTLGMRAWRLRLISIKDFKQTSSVDPTNLNRLNPSLPQCLIRCVLSPLSFAAFGLGYLWCYLDENSDCVHDKLTKTKVIVLPKS